MGDIRSAAIVSPVVSFSNSYKYAAVFSRVNYNLLDKYIVNFTGRRDGSSRLGRKNSFKNFGSVGLAWIFSEEQFMMDNPFFFKFW